MQFFVFSDEEIPLPDVEPASFLALLKFLYSDEVQIDPETVMTTLYTAKKYAVPALEKHCVDFLKRHLCADNAFMDGRGNCINGTKIEVNHEENLEDLFGIVSNHERLSESTEELKEKKN